MIKLINIITQNIILLGCCAISIFILFVLITFIKNVDDFAAITNLQFEVLTADYVVKWIKRRIDSKSSPHFTIEVKSDTEVTFKVHKKVQFNQ